MQHITKRGIMGTFGGQKLIPVLILLVIVGGSLILRILKSETQWKNSRLYSFTSLLNNCGDTELNNCSFKDYIFGQPIQQDDPCLIDFFKKEMLIRLPLKSEQNQSELNSKGDIPSNIEKFKYIEKLLIKPSGSGIVGEKTGQMSGFFIECGANDGEFISPTIRLEREYNWTGLLIEGNPIPFQSLVNKKRNAWAVNAAACITEHPHHVTFYTNPKHTGLSGLNARVEHGVSVNVTVQCIPLYTMLAALGIQTVDYLSLDTEGTELAILKTVPFDKIKFKIMTIEYGLIPGKQKALKDFLEPKGYKFVKEITDSLTLDCLYVHESLYDLASSIKI